MSGSYMGQSLQFLTLQPKYECSTDPLFQNPPPEKCFPYPKEEFKDVKGFCDNPGLYSRVNYTDEESLDNWFLKNHLACKSKAQLGLIGSMQFIGWAISSFIIPRLSDIYGRKWPYIASMILQLLAMIATFFSTSIEVTTAIMFFLGFSGVGRCSISFLYLMELLPQEKGTFYGTIVQMNNNMAYIYVALYFWLISIDWRWLEVFAIGMTLFCIIGSLFIPESPKFYLSKKRWDDAR
jgi:MFS family permease